MKELPKNYNPLEIEKNISERWMKSRAFHAEPDNRPKDERYVIMMPLPNVTGALHMGHAMDNVMQDLLIRWHRMMGHNTLWMPGTDHAGIATQAVVEKRLKEFEGITRHDIGREGLIEKIWQWKDQYQARIIQQQQRMGCSCDWERQRFTMDDICARAVRHNFFKMFSDGLIFRGKRLVNWDPFLRTTISDDEMYYETIQGHFWHLLYPVIDPKEGEPEYVSVATTRPETMLGDTAVAVHPDPEIALKKYIAELKEEFARTKADELEVQLAELEERMKNILPSLTKLKEMALDGRMVMLPLLNRPIPLITDEWAKPEKGSGCVKITPAHDHNDYAVWSRHRDFINIINILNPDGTLNDAAGPYKGLDRFDARKRVIEDLQKLDLLPKIENREVEIGHSDRSKTPVEPYLSDQWFVKMGDLDDGIIMGRGTKKEFKAPGLVQAAMDAVTQKRVKIHPERYTKTYLDWLSEKRDWPISRQLWWGHRIPVWAKELSKADLYKEPVFPLLEGYCKNKEKEVLLITFRGSDSEERIIINGSTLPDIPKMKGSTDETIWVDICLLEDIPELVKILEENGFPRDEDVLDTWFSSALWPFSTLGWPDPSTAALEKNQAALGAAGNNEDCLSYYYPGNCLVTARDIITLWVARMVLAGLYCLGDIPFSDVFIHANILDGKGVRMSKSKGNGIDPVDIIDFYGTDAMRYVLCDMQTGTQDIRLPVTAVCPSCGYANDLGNTQHGSTIFSYVCGKRPDGGTEKGSCGKEFDVLGTLPDLPQSKPFSERFEIGRSFCTKLWNSARFAFINLASRSADIPDVTELNLEDSWILQELSTAISETRKGLEEYNPSYALNAIRNFFWGSFCDWYLEAIKPRVAGKTANSGAAFATLAYVLDQTLRLLHPFVPFITEYLWQLLGEIVPDRSIGSFIICSKKENLISADWPKPLPEYENNEIAKAFQAVQSIIRAIREVRAERQLSPREEISVTLKITEAAAAPLRDNQDLIITLAGLGKLEFDPKASLTEGDAVQIVGETTVFIHNIIDNTKEKARLTEEKQKIEKEIEFVQKKLGNSNFVDKAPEDVVAVQRNKLADYEAQLKTVTENLKALENV